MPDSNCCLTQQDIPSTEKAFKFHDRQYLAALVCQNQKIIELLTAGNALLTEIEANTTPESV